MLFSLDIGIDLGTANTLVFVKGKGIVIREPSVVAVDQKYNPPRVVAVGTEAKEMIGRTPGSITAVRPLKDGVIADFDITADMLKAFIKKVTKNSPLARVRVMICIPSGVTGVERNAVNDAARSAGANMSASLRSPWLPLSARVSPSPSPPEAWSSTSAAARAKLPLSPWATLLPRTPQESRATILMSPSSTTSRKIQPAHRRENR